MVYVVMSGNVGGLSHSPWMSINFGQAAICTSSDFAFPLNGIAAEGVVNTQTVVIADLDLGALDIQRQSASVRPLLDRRHDIHELTAKVPIEHVTVAWSPFGRTQPTLSCGAQCTVRSRVMPPRLDGASRHWPSTPRSARNGAATSDRQLSPGFTPLKSCRGSNRDLIAFNHPDRNRSDRKQARDAATMLRPGVACARPQRREPSMYQEYAQHDATSLAALIARGEVSASEVLEAALLRAAEVDPQLASICIPMEAIARRRAQQDLQGPFAGVPFLLKDIGQDYAGVPSTSGSRALRHWVPQQHAALVRRFLDAGLVVFGKTATPEFALRAETAPRIWDRPTRNPWDPTRTPGGSSGGAAAAVAAGIVPVAGASDGGGSIRIPAAYCGLFGLRPSRGRVPSGPDQGEVWDGASSQHVLTRSVRDSARMLDAIAGADVGDPFAIAGPQRPFADEILQPPRRLRIGYCTESPLGTPVHAECVQAVTNAARLLEDLGHAVEPTAAPINGAALARSYISMYFGQTAASLANARRLSGASDRAFELETRILALLGRTLSAGDYVDERLRWNDYARALGRFHQTYDLYLTPTTAQPPNRIGELATPAAQRVAATLVLALHAGRLLLKSGMIDSLVTTSLQRVPFTQLSNLTGTPSMSVPLHWAPVEPNGPELPFGVQFVARFGDEATLLQLAAQLEQAQPWAARRPPL